MDDGPELVFVGHGGRCYDGDLKFVWIGDSCWVKGGEGAAELLALSALSARVSDLSPLSSPFFCVDDHRSSSLAKLTY